MAPFSSFRTGTGTGCPSVSSPLESVPGVARRKRPNKASNKDRVHPHDPEARTTKMKDVRTRPVHKFEHAVDMDTGAVAGVTVQTPDEAERRPAEAGTEAQEVVAGKGYRSNRTMTGVKDRGMRSCVSEPNRGRRKWKGRRDAQKAVCADRRRIRGDRGRRRLRRRGEKVERAFAHMLETGGMRRVHVRGQENIRTPPWPSWGLATRGAETMLRAGGRGRQAYWCTGARIRT